MTAELRATGSYEPSTSTALSVRNLKTAFRQGGNWTEVVKGISFDVAAGETLAIVGESGSGKSVTGYSIMRLLAENSRTEGEIMLGGRNLLSVPEDEMRRIRGNAVSMIFQEAMTSLNPVFPIGKQIAEAISLHNPDMTPEAIKQKALRLMERVRIPAATTRYDEYPHNFSGGMRQRVMIAMALSCRPQLLIADEPTTALDVTIQAQILNLIKEIQEEEKMSVIFITHDMGVVAEVADRMAVMFRGEIVETGTTKEIFKGAQHPYTRMLLDAVPRLGSMQGVSQPVKFSLIDPKTGIRGAPDEPVDTVKSDNPVLQVKDLCVRFDIRGGWFRTVSSRIHAVEGVSFDLHAGETLSIVGESGCGKSTTGRGLMRLVKPTGGSVTLAGRELMSMTPGELREARRDIQMIFQDPFASLSPRRTVGQAIAEPFITHGLGNSAQARTLVADLLERVGLKPDMANRLPHQFSGGQRQRICIARALALSPKVIVADESVSALDVSVKAQVINLLMDLQRDLGIAFVFISHDMAVVERVSHRVAVMYLGEVVEIGPRDKIFASPAHPYTQKLLSAVPMPDPDSRLIRRAADTSEPKSALRSVDFVVDRKPMTEVSEGHFVQS
ncbi:MULTISPECIES: ABC transporter ATP-binding protein [Rhizobium/Agrobacterium group]|uniref:ABC transporter ATP-binding protein n=1 Tax=Rhizobium/Agrobacterium group TaxID=227290 RepID=UPI001ADAD382|nr:MULTISPECIES: ABC transporter ATP-binding protein [Rhizobium/Agrobacterium group]MBO9112421.1 ABC transporter ATP-binding protein [Agrobacterium sp. S2/73]QXZ76603.1 ABC transporter ATP-binding protein [Agrobacterium sp. S7/73]QYA17367.1 ABC transporter ATP-binding protein [Rhizobium sp. AB2/73]UEQ85691.1 ABC transporter ATP-binding protein [Rhizobium sp. AB2/73]